MGRQQTTEEVEALKKKQLRELRLSNLTIGQEARRRTGFPYPTNKKEREILQNGMPETYISTRFWEDWEICASSANLCDGEDARKAHPYLFWLNSQLVATCARRKDESDHYYGYHFWNSARQEEEFLIVKDVEAWNAWCKAVVIPVKLARRGLSEWLMDRGKDELESRIIAAKKHPWPGSDLNAPWAVSTKINPNNMQFVT